MKIKFILLSTLLFLPLGCFNETGKNHEAAVRHAQGYVKALNEAGLEATLIQCNREDSAPMDGYLSCTLAINGEREQVECAGAAFFFENDGCRDPKVSTISTTGGGGVWFNEGSNTSTNRSRSKK